MNERNEFTKKTKLYAFRRAMGRCEECSRLLRPGEIEYHHIIECTMGGTNELSNCRVLCSRPCHENITRDRTTVIAKSNRLREREAGIRRDKRKTFRAWRRFNGTIVNSDDR